MLPCSHGGSNLSDLRCAECAATCLCPASFGAPERRQRRVVHGAMPPHAVALLNDRRAGLVPSAGKASAATKLRRDRSPSSRRKRLSGGNHLRVDFRYGMPSAVRSAAHCTCDEPASLAAIGVVWGQHSFGGLANISTRANSTVAAYRPWPAAGRPSGCVRRANAARRCDLCR